MGSVFIVRLAWPGTPLVAGQLSGTGTGNRFRNIAQPGTGINVSLACSSGRCVSGDRMADHLSCLADSGPDGNTIDGTFVSAAKDVFGNGKKRLF